MTPTGRMSREKVVLGKSVDDTPEHDDPRIEVLLADLFAGEETGADAEHDQEDHGVPNKGGT